MAEKGDFALLSKNSYRLHELSRESWNSLQPAAADAGNKGAIAFVDGGNAEMLKTPAAEIHRIRTAVVVISGKKLALARQKEGYAIIKASVDNVNGEGKLLYEAKFFNSNLDGMLDGNTLEFQTGELAASGNGEAMGKAAEIIRKLAELAAARWAAQKLGDSVNAIVLDGTLETFGSKEQKGMELLKAEAATKGMHLGAVAKTCSLLTGSGSSLIATAEEASNGRTGLLAVAEGMAERHMAKIAVAKLNSSATHLFRIECCTDMGKFAAELAAQSNDLAFPGYPYGLMMADRFARISDSDTELTKAKMMATADGELKGLMNQAKALDAHSILDNI